MRGFTATIQAGVDAARLLVRRMEIPNRCVQAIAAQELAAAHERAQARIDRGECGYLDNSEKECETEDGQ